MSLSQFEDFLWRRSGRLVDSLTMWGYEIASLSPRGERAGYDIPALVDPPIGKIRVVGRYGLPDGRAARNVYVDASEIWVEGRDASGPREIEGNTLTAYRYHAQLGDGSRDRMRFDYDPGHPHLMSHIHGFGRENDDREFTTPMKFGAALNAFENQLARLVMAGFSPTAL